jgi:hypothetical protein
LSSFSLAAAAIRSSRSFLFLSFSNRIFLFSSSSIARAFLSSSALIRSSSAFFFAAWIFLCSACSLSSFRRSLVACSYNDSQSPPPCHSSRGVAYLLCNGLSHLNRFHRARGGLEA